ncbi:MAG: MATE family efflux transporter [Patescibacteria group bacterium]
MNYKKNNLIEGSILKSIFALSIPIIFANILQTAYQLTDTFWVGRLGANAVAAVSISFPIIFLLVSLGGGLAMAGTILVAQYKGKGDKKSTDHIATQTIAMVLIVSFILSVLGYILAPILIKMMGVEPVIFKDSLSYMRISMIGVVFMFGFAVFQSLMRGVGDVKTPMYIVLGTVLLNLILDPLFIFGYGSIPAFGVGGAAVASIATEGLSAIIGIFILIKGKYNVQINLNNLKPDFKLIKKMFFLGLPVSIEQSARALGMTAMTFLVAGFGTIALAAYGIGGRMLSFIIIPALGFSMATSTLVGQNIGAGKNDRAEKVIKISAIIGFTVLSILGLFAFIFAEQLCAFFMPGEIEAIKYATLFMKIMAPTFGFIGLHMTYGGAFRGAGETFVPMILSIISLWAIQFPLAFVLSRYTSWNEIGIWVAFPISNIIATIITVLWFMKGTWKLKKITEEIEISEKISEETIIEEGL